MPATTSPPPATPAQKAATASTAQTSRTPSPSATRRTTSRGVPFGGSPEVIHHTPSAMTAMRAIGAATAPRNRPPETRATSAAPSATAPRMVTARPRPSTGGGTPCDGSASGTSSTPARYSRRPAPPAKTSATAATRTMIGSMPKCSARPPQTPAIQRSFRERTSRGPSGGGVAACSVVGSGSGVGSFGSMAPGSRAAAPPTIGNAP